MRKKISELNMLSLEEEYMLKEQFNNTFADYSRDKCVHQLFEEQALKTPDKTAVIACDKTLTYDELNKLSNRIANSLIEKGVKANDIVAFALPRESSLIAVMFGILKSGAAYLPIDLDFPQDRVEYMLSDSNAKFFITEENINEFISDNEENPNVKMTSDNCCYCIYTSGSTGNPKGTLIRHRNLVNFCDNNSKNYQTEMIRNGSCIISTFKTCFDAFGVDSMLFILNGKTVVLTNEAEMSNGDLLAGLINRYNVDVIHTTPTIVSMLCESEKYTKALNNIHIMMIAAEIFNESLCERLKQYTDAKIFNGYGPTETTIGVSFGKIKWGNIIWN